MSSSVKITIILKSEIDSQEELKEAAEMYVNFWEEELRYDSSTSASDIEIVSYEIKDGNDGNET